jgi:hypothetical protein
MVLVSLQRVLNRSGPDALSVISISLNLENDPRIADGFAAPVDLGTREENVVSNTKDARQSQENNISAGLLIEFSGPFEEVDLVISSFLITFHWKKFQSNTCISTALSATILWYRPTNGQSQRHRRL